MKWFVLAVVLLLVGCASPSGSKQPNWSDSSYGAIQTELAESGQLKLHHFCNTSGCETRATADLYMYPSLRTAVAGVVVENGSVARVNLREVQGNWEVGCVFQDGSFLSFKKSPALWVAFRQGKACPAYTSTLVAN